MYETEYRALELIGPVLLYKDNWNCLELYSHMF